jgi:predicted ArsR family transcriptional regulator
LFPDLIRTLPHESIRSATRRQVEEKQEDEVLELMKRPWAKKKGYITAADVRRARITLSPEAARTLLARMEKEGLLVSVEVTPEHGGKTYRQYRLAESANPVPG